jgi:molybdopterin/thiamine biosynthesis adenylyltransferase
VRWVEYLPWYKRLPKTFSEECEEMQKRHFTLDQQALAQCVVRFVGFSSFEPSLELTVEYPDSFPSHPPRISTPPGWPLLQRHHRPVTRELCLFGRNQRRWSAELFGTSAIDEADKVIRDMKSIDSQTSTISHEASDSDALVDDVPEPMTTSYIYRSNTFILVPPTLTEFGNNLPVGTVASFRLRLKAWPGQTESRNASGRGVLTEIRAGKAIVTGEALYQGVVSPGIDISNGSLIRLAAAPPIFTTGIQFGEWLHNVKYERRDWMAFVFPQESGDSKTEELAWLLVRSKSERWAEPLRTFALTQNGQNIRLPNLTTIRQKKVVLIGCGSVGSKIGAALAATGVERFGLVDFDFIEPDNAVRHEVGVDCFGMFKVNALGSRIVQLNPRAWNKVETSTMLIGGTKQPDQEKQVQTMIAGAGIVVDTTGEHSVSRYLNDVCAAFGVPQAYATVTNGAWAGEIVRVIPGRSACWLCWNQQYYEVPPPGEKTPDPGLFAPGCDLATFTGTTYEVGVVANLACSLIADTLLIDEADRQHFNGDYIRWQLKDESGNILPKIEVLPVNKRRVCRICGKS